VPSATPLPWDPIAEAHRHWREHGWSTAADGMALVTSVMRTQQIMLSRVEAALKPFELTFARYEMLRLLSFARDGSLPMAAASARLQVHPTSVTSIVDRLERDGLVRRAAHPTDGRATLIEITPAGRTDVERATVALNANCFDDIRIAPEDSAELIRILAAFRRDAGDFVDPVAPPEPL
jgi:DNA-binding MarR family transcriptional regulator